LSYEVPGSSHAWGVLNVSARYASTPNPGAPTSKGRSRDRPFSYEVPGNSHAGACSMSRRGAPRLQIRAPRLRKVDREIGLCRMRSPVVVRAQGALNVSLCSTAHAWGVLNVSARYASTPNPGAPTSKGRSRDRPLSYEVPGSCSRTGRAQCLAVLDGARLGRAQCLGAVRLDPRSGRLDSEEREPAIRWLSQNDQRSACCPFIRYI